MNPTVDLLKITPLILTFNEEPNIQRCLHNLQWARRILVVDSFSTDQTLDIISTYKNVDLVQRSFDTHACQWNYGLGLVDSPWVLSLDADYIVTESLLLEIANVLDIADAKSISGCRIPFRYCVAGRPLRGCVLPPRIALFRHEHACYRDDGHTQDLQLLGPCTDLRNPILHDDRKPLSRWLWAQNRYLALEVAKLLETPHHQLSFADRLRKRHVIAPFAVLALCLVRYGGVLDGWRGWFYAFQRMYVETLLSLMLWDAKASRSIKAASVAKSPMS